MRYGGCQGRLQVILFMRVGAGYPRPQRGVQAGIHTEVPAPMGIHVTRHGSLSNPLFRMRCASGFTPARIQ